MKYYIKNALIPFVYLFFMAITALGILSIGDHLLWLKIILAILNLALYEVIVCAFSFKQGQDAVKVRNANDLERRQIVLTGEDRPLKLSEEYKPYKGFLIGLTVCAPLILLMIIHTIVFLCGGGIGFGVAGSLLYLVVYIFFRMGVTTVATAYTVFTSLVAIPVIVLSTGIAYMLGGRKVELQYKKIEENQRRIYGDGQ